MCRICLSEEENDEDPLIAPCNCQGSAGFIHVNCLRQWLATKLTVKVTTNSVNYVWKENKCELC